jgi:glycosyltransferase involved in cell wall biosynthesis
MRDLLTKGRTYEKVLLTVSRLAPEKNVGFLADVLDRIGDAGLAIVGDGPLRPALERRFAGKNAHFIGYLKGKDLAAAYASADAFVYASETETMGNVILEAMACGRTVVAPRAGGIPSLVNHGETGMLYSPGNIDECVQHTRTALAEDGVGAEVGRAARAWVENCSWSNSINEVRQIYLESIEQCGRASARTTWRQRVAKTVVSCMVSGFETMSREKRSRPATARVRPAALARA